MPGRSVAVGLPKWLARCFVALLSVASVLPATCLAETSALDAEELQFFENRIRPLFVERCVGCHSPQSKNGKALAPKGGLRLDSRAGWLRGGDTGRVVVPGRPDDSLLIAAVRYESADLQMPPDGKLTQAQIDDLARWVQMGAPDPRLENTAESAGVVEGFDVASRRAKHWSWQPLSRSAVPTVTAADWARDDLDRFVLARLEEAGLKPASETDRRTWLRRVSFALIGLSPTADELDAFLSDKVEGAYERVVDRLLASPHFGETWGQHWLDVVRYAESYGHEADSLIAEAYRYRDYVVRAFNRDLPYDQFVVEHIAGDLVEEPRLDPVERTNQSIQGTGFWHFGDANHAPVDIRGDEAERVHNQIDTFSKAFLGLALGCARCHDHKFDAISTRDYYAFFGFLQSSGRQYADVSDPLRQRRAAQALTAVADAHRPPVVAAFRDLKAAQFRELGRYLEAALEISDYTDLRARVERDGLDEATLERVLAHIGIAAGEPHHPFHVLSVLGGTRELTLLEERKAAVKEHWGRRTAEFRAGLAAMRVLKSVKKGERDYEVAERPWQPSDVVIDYSPSPTRAMSAEPWITNGYRFGSEPLAAGRALLGGAEVPIRGFLAAGAATGRIALQKCSGLLRTKTFEVDGDRIWLEVRGSGQAFFAIDSYRLVNGPLHRVAKKRLAGSFDRWRWESQNLREYQGHRVHIEFHADSEFAVRRVLFADASPPALADVPDAFLESVLGADDFSAGTVARRLTEAMAAVAERLGPDGLDSGSESVAVDARFLDWAIRNDRILPPPAAAGVASDSGAADLAPLAAALANAHSAYTAARVAAEELVPPVQLALALLDGTGEDEPVHIRGNHKTLTAERVPRRFLEAVAGTDAIQTSRGSGRLGVARTVTDGSTPLVPRVMVNRIWHHLFGRGIVQTTNDFGAMGTPPSHPRLLDHLSARFVDGGWSLKKLLRDVVLSSTYRMSSHPSPTGNQLDPSNVLLHRMPIRRLGAEAIRDHILAVSGRLDLTVGGPSVTVYIGEHFRNNRSPREQGPLDGSGRRSIYVQVRRNHVSSMLVAFDRPVPVFSVGNRSVSNAPAQPLILLNDPFVHEQAALWAAWLLEEEERDVEARLRDAYLSAYLRLPTPDEKEAAKGFLEEQRLRYAKLAEESSEKRAWTDLCHTLMNVKEFFFVN